MPRNAFGFDQCACTEGSTSGGSFCTSSDHVLDQCRGRAAEYAAETVAALPERRR